MATADASRVAPWWLVGFFLLATLGELCLAPVGLSYRGLFIAVF